MIKHLIIILQQYATIYFSFGPHLTAQDFPLTLYSSITLSRLRGPSEVPGIKPGSGVHKAKALSRYLLYPYATMYVLLNSY